MIVYGGDYEHTLEIAGERDGLRIDYQVLDRPSLFAKVLQRQTFDACEFSLSNYLMLRDRGEDWLVALPVFPVRAFRHGAIWVRRDSVITDFAELRGARVGIPDYSMTAGVWGRGILGERHGLPWREIAWRSSGTPRFPPPKGVDVAPIEGDLEDALAEGRLDALFHPSPRDALKPERRFRTLAGDAVAAERDYFAQTRIYPIAHVVVAPRSVIASHPAFPGAVMAAYAHAKRRADQRRLSATYLPWGAAAWRHAHDVFGGDPTPYGLGPGNISVIAKLQDYLLDQDLIRRRADLADLFVSDTETAEAAA